MRRLLKHSSGRGAMQKVPVRHRAGHLGPTAMNWVGDHASVQETRGRADGALMPWSAEGHTRLCLAGRPYPMRLREVASMGGWL